MFCAKCGAALENGATFCYNCGAATGITPKTLCPYCGAVLPDGAGFCAVCGNMVGGYGAVSEPPAQPKKKKMLGILIAAAAALLAVAALLCVLLLVGKSGRQNQNYNSTYADLSEVRTYAQKTLGFKNGTEDLYYCRYYEALVRGEEMLLVQYKEKKRDKEFKYLVFAYESDLNEFYERDDDSDFPVEPRVRELESSDKKHSSYVLRCSVDGDSFYEYIVCDKDGRVIRWMPYCWDEDADSWAVFYQYDEDGRITAAILYDDVSPDDFLSVDYERNKLGGNYDSELSAEYNKDGSLNKLDVSDDDGKYATYFLFEYDDEGRREKTTCMYNWGDGSNFRTYSTLEYLRGKVNGLDGIATGAISSYYGEEASPKWTDRYFIDYRSSGIQKIEED